MSTVTLYPSGPATGISLGSGAIVTNYGPGTVSYSDTADPFVAEGTIAAAASAALTGTQFFQAAAGAVLGITRAGVTVAQESIVRKAAIQTINNVGGTTDDTSTLTADLALVFAGAANAEYFITAELFMQAASANADWKVGWSISGGGSNSALWGVVAPHNAFTGAGFGQLATSGSGLVSLRNLAQTGLFGAVAGTQGVTIKGKFTLGAIPGNIVFRWAQSTATSEDSSVLPGSILRVVPTL